MAAELEDEHEDEDDQERVEDSDLEDVAKAEILRRFRGVHRRQGVEIVPVEAQGLLELVFRIIPGSSCCEKNS